MDDPLPSPPAPAPPDPDVPGQGPGLSYIPALDGVRALPSSG